MNRNQDVLRASETRNPMNVQIVEAIDNPEEVTPSIKGRLNYCKTMGNKYIKVTCKKDPSELVVITVLDKKS